MTVLLKTESSEGYTYKVTDTGDGFYSFTVYQNDNLDYIFSDTCLTKAEAIGRMFTQFVIDEDVLDPLVISNKENK